MELADTVSGQLDLKGEQVHYYMDSKVVSDSLFNEQRRFYLNVANCVARIRRSSSFAQWHFVPTVENPTDQGARPVPADQMAGSMWLHGPYSLRLPEDTHSEKTFDLVSPNEDKEFRPDITTCKTTVEEMSGLGTKRWEKFISWKKLVRSISVLQHVRSTCKGKQVS